MMEKTYEGFLKINKRKKPTFGDIECCFVDLEDDGFWMQYIGDHIIIRKHKIYPNIASPAYQMTYNFNIDSVKETLLFAIPYLTENYNFKLSDIQVGFFNNSPRDFKTFKDVESMLEFFKINSNCDISVIDIYYGSIKDVFRRPL